MAIPKHHIGFRGDMCQCGRRASLIHCPRCGSSSNRARHNRYHEFMDGSIKKVDIELVCNLCGHPFVHEDRQWCQATPIGAADAARKLQILAEAESSPDLSTNERTAASTARKLLNELKEIGPSNEAEVKALEVLERQSKDADEQKYDDYVRILKTLEGEYNEEVLKYKSVGQPHPDTLPEYIEKSLIQYGIEKVEKPHSKE